MKETDEIAAILYDLSDFCDKLNESTSQEVISLNNDLKEVKEKFRNHIVSKVESK